VEDRGRFQRTAAVQSARRLRGPADLTALLLDTEVLIWWDANDKRLGERARLAIRDAPDVYVSAASAWEIAIKAALGKLRTTRKPSDAVADAAFERLPVTFEHAEAVLTLPAHHRDPFDRLIVAAAQTEGLTIVSSDSQFRLYDVPLIDARA
jgi:PIN domain nuclease of toxin-antitoxin system